MSCYLGGDSAALVDNAKDIPYPDPQRLADLLARPDIRAILPPQIRPSDAEIGPVRERMLLKGALADVTAAAVRVLLLIPPVFLALALTLFFTMGARMALSARVLNRRTAS